MGPRKRSKPNPEDEADSPAPEPQNGQSVPTPTHESPSEPSVSRPPSSRKSSLAAGADSPSSGTTWHGGTWRRGNKSLPVTQVAKESITSVGSAASNAINSARSRTPPVNSPLRSPAAYLSRHVASPSRSSLNLSGNTTRSSPNSTIQDAKPAVVGDDLPPKEQAQELKNAEGSQIPDIQPVEGEHASAESSGQDGKTELERRDDNERDTGGWLAWFSKSDTSKKDDSDKNNAKAYKGQDAPSTSQQDAPITSEECKSDSVQVSSEVSQDQRRSWLAYLYNTSKATDSSVVKSEDEAKDAPEVSQSSQAQAPDDNHSGTALDSANQPTLTAGKSYGWAFWSRETKKSDGEKNSEPSKTGELAQSGSPSQSKPENDVIDEARGIPIKLTKQANAQNGNASDALAAETLHDPSSSSNKENIPVLSKGDAAGVKPKAKALSENLLLPPFRSTFRTASKPGLIQQLSRLLQLGQAPEPQHVHLCSSPRVKRALAIGIHGYFPTPLIRSVLGQPTGTSIKFANSAASAIQKWMDSQGFSCEVEKVALEGEGKIAERVDLLWNLLLNWIEKIRSADFIMISCHSQGVPVAMMLIAKLIGFGCLSSTRVGVCAMAGVNLGPFGDYKSRWIGGSAGELFDFGRPDSTVSKDYETALDVVLRAGVRIVFVGSIDDQLVSLDSSTFGTLSHPHIYRAVFVDGRIHAPDFLTHLVGFALKLRNLGISDHGLIRELSSPLAGSLYSGEGHSRIYEDESVYTLAVEYALETTAVGTNVPMHVHRPVTAAGGSASSNGGGSIANGGGGTAAQNPYILPFAMRGLLEEEYVKTELYGEITQLIRQFDDWRPTTKALKDVKFRLEGVRSKL